MHLSLCFHILLLTLSRVRGAVHQRATCTPLAQGFDALDDTPLINDAIVKCGDGGTIVLPADQIYSIRSPFNFSACHGCDFQVEGTLLMSSDTSLWTGKDALFSLPGMKDITIRSVTGTGVIDGNSIAFYARPRWDHQELNNAPYFATITNGSSNIIFSGLAIKNVPMKFFHTNGNATNLRFENLLLSVEMQEGNRAGIADWESTGFELGGVSDVFINNVQMNFTASNPKARVGVCIAIDRGTHGVSVTNVNCYNAKEGAVIMLEQFMNGPGIGGYRYERVTGSGISDVTIRNFTFEGDVAAGWKNEIADDKIRNVTWDDVHIVSGQAVMANECFLRCGCSDEFSHACFARQDGREGSSPGVVGKWPQYSNVVFSNFKGNPGTPPANGWGCPPNATVCSISFQNWGSS